MAAISSLQSMAKSREKAAAGGGKGLTDEQAARLRPLVKKWVDEHNQTKLEEALEKRGVSWRQSTISGFINRNGGVSVVVALNFCDMIGVNGYEFLSLPAQRPLGEEPDPTDPFPARAKVIAATRRFFPKEVIDLVREIKHYRGVGEGFTESDWIAELHSANVDFERRAGKLLPHDKHAVGKSTATDEGQLPNAVRKSGRRA